MQKLSDKINNGCINIFRFLILLYQNKADYDSVMEIFNSDIEERGDKNVAQVVLNKYINALRVFGIKINKVKNKFYLESSLYSVPFNDDDLKSLSIFINAVKNFPDKDISDNVNEFISNLLLRMNNSDRVKLNNLIGNYDFSFFYSDIQKQIEDCKQYCKENQILNIIYLNKGREVKRKCCAKELIYETKHTYLSVYDILKHEVAEIPLSKILSVESQPLKGKSEVTTTVIYKLKGRLAKNYKVKENEYLESGPDKDGYITVVNRDEPIDRLFSRLMRYDKCCEIISPKYLRNEMLNLIENTLNNYNA